MPIMPKQPEIVITLGYDGSPTFEVNGVTGPSCAGLTAALESAFGAVVSDEKKPAYAEQRNVVQQQRLQAR